jgi:hypothetical protein
MFSGFTVVKKQTIPVPYESGSAFPKVWCQDPDLDPDMFHEAQKAAISHKIFLSKKCVNR